MRWNMASPGAGTVRGLDSLLGVLQYKDAQKKRDERLEASKLERETIRAEQKKRYDEQMNIEKLKFQKGSFTAIGHSMKEYLDGNTSWETIESGLGKISSKFDEASPGLGDPLNAVVKNSPNRVRTKNPITGQETYYSDDELEEQRKKYAEEVYLRSLAGVQSLGGDIGKQEAKIGKRTYTGIKDGKIITREVTSKEEAKLAESAGLTEGVKPKDKDSGADKTWETQRDAFIKQGFDEATATGLATGTIKLSTDPITGAKTIVDVAKGTSRPVKEEGVVEEDISQDAEENEGPTLYEMADLTAGVWSGVKAGASKISGQIGLPTAEKTEYARQRITSAQNELIRSLSINPKFPVAEIKRIKEETSIEPKLLDNKKSLRTRMRAIDDYLNNKALSLQRLIADKRTPKTQKIESMQTLEAINTFRKQLGVPVSDPDGYKPTDEEYELLNKYQD